ncbi:MAG TPA: guanylate kinase [Gammaproteobacteria bacterium]|nr:guanylate kinase [Gammaproteobacteria bacterium]
MQTSPPQVLMGTLYVIAAPSGTGKTSLTSALVRTLHDIKISISHTTREQRPGEQHGVHYWFVSIAEFKAMLAQDIFLESAEVFGNYYGTSRHWVLQQLESGTDVILEIDWQGAQQVRKLFPQSVSIFILPPSADLLRKRLQTRQQDHVEVIEKRLAAAASEVAHYREFDYLVVNDSFDDALLDMQAIVRANRLILSKQLQRNQKLLAELQQKQ